MKHFIILITIIMFFGCSVSYKHKEHSSISYSSSSGTSKPVYNPGNTKSPTDNVDNTQDSEDDTIDLSAGTTANEHYLDENGNAVGEMMPTPLPVEIEDIENTEPTIEELDSSTDLGTAKPNEHYLDENGNAVGEMMPTPFPVEIDDDGKPTKEKLESKPGGVIKPVKAKPIKAEKALSWQTDFDKVLEEATMYGKTVFLLFSDPMCGGCQVLKKDIINTEEFRTVSGQSLVLCIVNFSHPNKSALQKRYGVKVYPTAVLTDEKGNLLKKLQGEKYKKSKYLSIISDTHWARARK